MKNTRLIMLFLMALAWTSCHKDKELDAKDPVVSNEEMTVSGSQARFEWRVDFSGQFQTGVELSQDESMSDVRRVEATKVEEKYVAVVGNLLMGTKYYYRIVVWNKFNNFEEETKSFTTSQTFNVALTCLPEEGGTATGDGTYTDGDTCTLIATANEGYRFVNWVENENQVSDKMEYSFTVTSNRNIVACFSELQLDEYTINVSVNPSQGGVVTGNGTYFAGETCTLTATANEGYHFVNWMENGNEIQGAGANYTFTVTGDRTLVANFALLQPDEYVVSVSANPSYGGMATVSGDGTFTYGQSCTVTATPANGYTFDSWTENGQVVAEAEASYTFTVTGNRTLVANFTQQQYTINVSADPYAGGTATVSGNGTFTYGQTCTVTATPTNGYTFDFWTENGQVVAEADTSYTFTVTGNRTLVANFTQQQYTINVSANPYAGGTATVSGNGVFTYGQTCTVTAIPANGYTFDSWTENGQVVSEAGASYTFTVTGNRTLVANFMQQQYTINVSANPYAGGTATVSGNGTFTYGQTCTVTATPANGYTFDSWTENNVQVSRDEEYAFSVTGNRTLVANFLEQPSCPIGAINGKFSINPDKDMVYFSQGNLQYNAAQGTHQCADGSTKPGTWRFASNQWDYVGGTFNGQEYGTVYENGVKCDNAMISPNYSGWIDLFGWGTSGWNNGNTYYQPWDTDKSNGSLYGPQGLHDLTGTYANADWGVYNAISNGGNQSGLWRSLTLSEWKHIILDREGNRFAKALIVNGSETIKGLILLPDDWDANVYTLQYINVTNVNFEANSITTSQWAVLEQAGAVFLPVTGYRLGVETKEINNIVGHYWQGSTHLDADKAYNTAFAFSYLNYNEYYYRYGGESVRLVCPAER